MPSSPSWPWRRARRCSGARRFQVPLSAWRTFVMLRESVGPKAKGEGIETRRKGTLRRDLLGTIFSFFLPPFLDLLQLPLDRPSAAASSPSSCCSSSRPFSHTHIQWRPLSFSFLLPLVLKTLATKKNEKKPKPKKPQRPRLAPCSARLPPLRLALQALSARPGLARARALFQ